MAELEQAKGFGKRDALIEIEHQMQKIWEEEKLFEVDYNPDKPGREPNQGDNYWMGTFPFPYMNGKLHLGHSFSLSKLEFAAGFEMMQGKRVLLPFGFHATGQPILVKRSHKERKQASFLKPNNLTNFNNKRNNFILSI